MTYTFSDNWAFDSHLVAVLQFHICEIFMETFNMESSLFQYYWLLLKNQMSRQK